jgi:hypothetical protein
MEQRVGKLSDVEQNSTTPKKPFKRGPGRPRSVPLVIDRNPDAPSTAQNGKLNNGRSGHVVKNKRSLLVKPSGNIDRNIVGRSVKQIVPWDYWHYPGRTAAFVEMLDYTVATETAGKWLQTGKCPDWVLPIIESHLEQRLAALIRGLDELRDEIRRRENLVEQRHGFHVVQSDGQARRGSSNRKPKTTEKL